VQDVAVTLLALTEADPQTRVFGQCLALEVLDVCEQLIGTCCQPDPLKQIRE
jgi:hypothetical protein